MAASPILIGGEFFRRIRKDSCYCIDKTGLLEELRSPKPPMVLLFTRPHRFGRALMMPLTSKDEFDHVPAERIVS